LKMQLIGHDDCALARIFIIKSLTFGLMYFLGEEVEDTDMELPKIYEPIETFKQLEDRLKYFLDQYNDIVRGSDMDLVFFPDAIIHLIKISRVIR